MITKSFLFAKSFSTSQRIFSITAVRFFFFQIEIVRVRERENGRRYIEQFRANYFLYMCTNKNVVYKHNRRDMILKGRPIYI